MFDEYFKYNVKLDTEEDKEMELSLEIIVASLFIILYFKSIYNCNLMFYLVVFYNC